MGAKVGDRGREVARTPRTLYEKTDALTTAPQALGDLSQAHQVVGCDPTDTQAVDRLDSRNGRRQGRFECRCLAFELGEVDSAG
jgi:hypothetical protein